MTKPDHNTPPHGPPVLGKPQSAILTKLFIALGFITVIAIIAGAVSIVTLNRFQSNFNTLINQNLPMLADAERISRLSATVADRGPALIISPDTWTRLNVIGQVDDDAKWLDETLKNIPTQQLSENRKKNLLKLKSSLLKIYATLNILTDKRISYNKHIVAIINDINQFQKGLITQHIDDIYSIEIPKNSSTQRQWYLSLHEIIYKLIQARDISNVIPLMSMQQDVIKQFSQVKSVLKTLPLETQYRVIDTIDHIDTIIHGKNSLFKIKRQDLKTTFKVKAALRRARTIAEQFLVASKLVTTDVSQAIAATNQSTNQSMKITLQAMIGFVLISAFIAVMTFRYISNTVLHRLEDLRQSMLAHAEGEEKSIDTSGDDEITEMAQSLEYLVETLRSREEGLRIAKEEAEQASTAKTRFLAAASHDLRQPLQALNLFVFALSNQELSDEKRVIIKHIRESLDSLKELLNTLLDISKLEAGVVQPNKKDFNAGQLIDRIKSEMETICLDKNLRLKTVPTDAYIYCDPSLLETILRNFLDNAIKYTNEGKILIGCRRRQTTLRFEIWDTGPGIAEKQRDLIFQDFYQIDNEARNRTQGLGLGLSIVKRISDLMGCVMGCQSTIGKGSLFWIEIPLSEHMPTAQKEPLPSPYEIEFAEVGANVVIIENDEQILLGLESVLKAQGYNTHCFTDITAEQIRTTFPNENNYPDVIIADYRLESRVTGSEVIARIRDVLNKEIPAIIVTGDTDPSRLLEAKNSGYPILHKPVLPETLLSTVQNCINGKDD